MIAFLLSLLPLVVVQAGPSGCGGASTDPNWGPYYYNGNCIQSCPSSTYTYGMSCYDSCPSGTYTYFSDCVSSCPEGTYTYYGNCVGGCPAKMYNRACVDSCPEGTYDYNNGCVDVCPSNTVTEGTRCLENCPSGSYKYNGGCISSCPSTASYLYNGECRDECWKSGLYIKFPGSNTCVYSCPKVYEWKNNTCLEQCAPNQKIAGNGCYDKCPSAIPYADGDTCVQTCPKYIDMTTYDCVDICPQGTTPDSRKFCWPQATPYYTPTYTPYPTYTRQGTYTPYINSCETNQYLDSNGVCHNYPTCSSNQYLGSDYKCHDYTVCNTNQYMNSNGTCVDYSIPSCPYYHNGTCVERCPPTTFIVYDKYCYEDCPLGFKRDGQYCDLTNFTYPCSSTQFLGSDNKCHDFNYNYTNPCPIYETLNAKGECVSYNYTNPCGADQWLFNNTCVPACKQGEFMDMNGHCMNPADMCKRGLPGAVYDPVTYKCECPEGSWMTRNNSFVPPVVCGKAPLDALQPLPHINCRSFIPFTLYDFTLDTCVCDREHPIIVSNPKDSFVPYTCEVAGTPTTVKQCIAPEYFDFIEGECVKGDIMIPTFTPVPTYTVRPSYTPMPSMCPEGTVVIDGGKCQVTVEASPLPSMCPEGTMITMEGCIRMSSSSTKTAMPSRKPSTTSTASRTPKPSDRPNSASSTVSASRTPKPSARVWADVSRKPLPSIEFQPPPREVKRSPAPSAWAKKTIVEIAPEERPPYIDAKVKLPGGNVTEMSKPEKIQDMQASLACALRMPLENIRITSITYIDEKGNKQKIDVDPSKFMMMGDGDIGCYSRNKTASSSTRRLLRQRQLQGKGSIDVDYSIVQPSDDILSMDTTQMNQVISTSPVILEVAASVGSASVESTAVEAVNSNILPSQTPSPTETPVSNFLRNIGMGAGIGGSGFLIIFALIVYRINKKFETKKKKEKEEEAERERKEKEKIQQRVLVNVENGVVNPLRVNSWRAPATKTHFNSYMGESQVRFSPVKTGTGV